MSALPQKAEMLQIPTLSHSRTVGRMRNKIRGEMMHNMVMLATIARQQQEINSLTAENAELRQRITDISGDWMAATGRITDVEQERDAYKSALDRIANDKTYCLGGTYPLCQKIAREALNGH